MFLFSPIMSNITPTLMAWKFVCQALSFSHTFQDHNVYLNFPYTMSARSYNPEIQMWTYFLFPLVKNCFCCCTLVLFLLRMLHTYIPLGFQTRETESHGFSFLMHLQSVVTWVLKFTSEIISGSVVMILLEFLRGSDPRPSCLAPYNNPWLLLSPDNPQHWR